MTCSICLEELESNVRTLECLHSFHTQCIDTWKNKNRTCPTCRHPFDPVKYKITLSIEPIEYSNTFETTDLSMFYRIFGIDFETRDDLIDFLIEFGVTDMPV